MSCAHCLQNFAPGEPAVEIGAAAVHQKCTRCGICNTSIVDFAAAELRDRNLCHADCWKKFDNPPPMSALFAGTRAAGTPSKAQVQKLLNRANNRLSGIQ